MTAEKSLRELMRQTFSEEELKDLTIELDIDFEDLPASLGKSGKIRELILLSERAGHITRLLDLLRIMRPNITWPDATVPLSESDLLGMAARPQLPYEPELIGIPQGLFLMGSDSENETPAHEVTLPDYWIGKYPITNEEYQEFVTSAGHPAPKKVGWFGKKAPRKKLDHPVAGVSWYDCVSYCQWLTEQSGRMYRLPTEAEWEKAARGVSGNPYPWGDTWDASRCNHAGTDTLPVSAHPHGVSAFGCFDMVGNVWEWTSTLWGSDWQKPDFSYPYVADDGREKLDAGPEFNRIFRGGSFGEDAGQLRCSARRWYGPDHADRRRGFRVVMIR